MDDLATAVRAALARRGMKQKELAARMKVREATVSDWLTGKSHPSIPQLEALRRELELRLDGITLATLDAPATGDDDSVTSESAA